MLANAVLVLVIVEPVKYSATLARVAGDYRKIKEQHGSRANSAPRTPSVLDGLFPLGIYL